jgi:hypothetical protein
MPPLCFGDIDFVSVFRSSLDSAEETAFEAAQEKHYAASVLSVAITTTNDEVISENNKFNRQSKGIAKKDFCFRRRKPKIKRFYST